MISLDDVKITVLDILLNVGRLEKTDIPLFFVNTKSNALPPNEKLVESVEILKKKRYIIEKNNVLMIDSQNRDNVISEVRQYLDESRVSSQRLYELSERLDFRIPWLLASVNENDGIKHVTFSDSFSDLNVMSLCMDLVSAKLAFQFGKYVGRYHDLTFYFRRYPFDVVSILQEQIERIIRPDTLRSFEDMVTLAMTLFLDSPLTLDDLKVNLPDLTTEHLTETVSKLAQKGLLSFKEDKITIKDEIRPFLQGYFVWSYGKKLNMSLFEIAKNKLNARMSNFYYYGLVERILSNKTVQTTSPFFVIDRSALKDVQNEDVIQAVKLGFLFSSKQQIVLNTYVISGIEGMLKESLQKESLLSIRSANMAELNVAMKEVLSLHSSKFRIQDPCADEETMRILTEYLDTESDVMLLLSIKRPDGSSMEDFTRSINSLKGKVKSLQVAFIGDKEHLEAPFKDTYVINDYFCARISCPIRDVGKVEEAYITLERVYDRNGKNIPAFDMLFKLGDRKWLDENGYIRMSLEEWINKFK